MGSLRMQNSPRIALHKNNIAEGGATSTHTSSDVFNDHVDASKMNTIDVFSRYCKCRAVPGHLLPKSNSLTQIIPFSLLSPLTTPSTPKNGTTATSTTPSHNPRINSLSSSPV
jgi:hypothetical protein